MAKSVKKFTHFILEQQIQFLPFSMHHLYYSNYNSIISEGHRVRRMRRTQLSAEKIISHQNPHFPSSPHSIHRTKSSRSLPKVQKSFYSLKQKLPSRFQADDIHNEYYKKGKQGGTQMAKEQLSKKFYRNTSLRQSKNSFFKSSSLPNYQTQMQATIQQYSADSSSSKIEQEKFASSKLSSKRKSEMKSSYGRKQREGKNSKLSRKTQRKPSQLCQLQNYGMGKETFPQNKMKLSSSIRQEKKNFPNCTSKHKQPSQKQEEDTYQIRKKLKNESNFILEDLGSEQKIKQKSKMSKVQNVQNRSSLKESFRDSFSQSKIQNFQFFLNSQNSQHRSDFSKLEPGNPSLMKVFKSNGKFHKKTSHISQNSQSVASVSILQDKKSSKINKTTQIPEMTKKISLKLDSIRQSNKFQNIPENTFSHNEKLRASFRNLPLTSREPSQHLRESRAKPMGNSLQEVMERIEIHDFIITLFSDFGEQTLDFHEGEEEKYEKVCYLLERKHFYEKANMIKALKGGKNVFKMSSIEIPSQILALYLQHPDVKAVVKQHEESNRALFKKLQKKFNELKGKYKNDDQVRLETPSDNFSKCIVDVLHRELQQLYPCLDNDDLSQEVLQKYQDRIIEIIEKIFVLSEFTGRKVKKLEFAQEIEDFYAYYEDNFPNLIATIEYFEQLQ